MRIAEGSKSLYKKQTWCSEMAFHDPECPISKKKSIGTAPKKIPMMPGGHDRWLLTGRMSQNQTAPPSGGVEGVSPAC